jgi:hypothetical protein
MEPRQLTIMAVLLMLGAALSAALSEHPLFNQSIGKYFLGGMASFGLMAAGCVKLLRARRETRPIA